MGVRVIHNEDGAVIYCSTTMQAFGPVFDNEDEANEFLEWLGQDARTFSPKELNDKHEEYTEIKSGDSVVEKNVRNLLTGLL